MSLLSMSNVTAHYGPSQALFSVDLDVGEGEVVALMGRNGMGKSTTIRAIFQMVDCDGTISFDGKKLNGMSNHRIARLGIGLVPEGRRAFAELTVSENLRSVERLGHWTFDTVTTLFPRLRERANQRAGSLSGGEQQMLVIGRALITNPRLLILDEATEGLAPIIRQEIWASIEQLKRETGLAILVVDKSLKEMRAICDRATIIERGRSVWSGRLEDLSADTSQRFLGI